MSYVPKLTTPIKFKRDVPNLLEPNDTICSIGSCFSEYIIDSFTIGGVDAVQNPNGIVYNAHSIANSIEQLGRPEKEIKESLFEYQDNWHSWEHHGRFSASSPSEVTKQILNGTSRFVEKLQRAKLIILTPSSSVVYRHITMDKIVANCHRVPNHLFKRQLLSVEENYTALQRAITAIRKINPTITIVLTLSPVRHYPNDLILNGRSKAHLLTAIHQIVESEAVEYFPSYEILLDELRDYRYFNEDLLHPTPLAREIILQRFMSYYCCDAMIEKIKQGHKKAAQSRHISKTDRLSLK
jgi:lysophospholipase L1-like esterase